MAWLKVLAIKDALKRARTERWLLYLDCDAVPRYLGWSPTSIGAAAAAAAGGRQQTVLFAAEEPSGLAKANAGVLLLRANATGSWDTARRLVQQWWAARDDDCTAGDCAEGWCAWHSRLMGSGDQTALSTVLARAGAVAAVGPHSTVNGPSGLLIAHLYGAKGPPATRLFTEVLLRHASELTAGCAVALPCARGAAFDARCAEAAERWVGPLLESVDVRDLSRQWRDSPSRVDPACATRLNARTLLFQDWMRRRDLERASEKARRRRQSASGRVTGRTGVLRR
eukprot:TRINITY_DN20082_c0_g1_i2.p2 TRINITY_DN20082_c0_g1~~TRINITY_DN20082_c0_g1_i2.p2  ORF type:complete len:283 (+),score=82.94 TRINITY_DN20082_c0_g1_i2:654-1502(+)